MTHWLAEVLRDAGLSVISHGMTPRPGNYEPRGVLNHHTAFLSSEHNPLPALRTVLRGRVGANEPKPLPGPLCQILIGADGWCHVITTGRANHAGSARASGPMPAGDGNDLYIGIEIDYSGYARPTDAQYDAAVRANAAILNHMGKSAEYARGHRETSTTGKWDPGQVDLDTFRADIAAAMRPAPPPPPEPEPPRRAPDMFVTRYGRSLYRLVTGDRIVGLSQGDFDALSKAGVTTVALSNEGVRSLERTLVAEIAPEHKEQS